MRNSTFKKSHFDKTKLWNDYCAMFLTRVDFVRQQQQPLLVCKVSRPDFQHKKFFGKKTATYHDGKGLLALFGPFQANFRCDLTSNIDIGQRLYIRLTPEKALKYSHQSQCVKCAELGSECLMKSPMMILAHMHMPATVVAQATLVFGRRPKAGSNVVVRYYKPWHIVVR